MTAAFPDKKIFKKSKTALLTALFLVAAACLLSFDKKKDEAALLQAKIELGDQIFFDKTLSNPDGQSCAVCHAPKTSFSDPDHEAVSEGMVDGFFTNRNSQSLAYISFVPPLKFDEAKGYWTGGFFWDGRSNTLQHQLSGPFFNIAEMNNTDTTMLVIEIRKAAYYKTLKKLYGKAKSDTELFDHVVDALSHFESSVRFNEFSSKYDHYIQGKADFTEEEKAGLELFQGKAHCVNCHSMGPRDGHVLFTDYGYHNVGVPRNENNPFYTTDKVVNPHGKEAIDNGLGDIVKDPRHNGKFRTPTLRNVQYTGPYFHNGGFKTIEEVVHFMNTRDKGGFASPEVKETVEKQRVGNLGLTAEEEAAIVAFLYTLSDGYIPQK